MVNYFIKFNGKDIKKLYKKGIGVLSKIISGNIKKEGLKSKELIKGNK